ncbi:MAG: hypothetical protein M1831_000116 [Alyxoria varia]|nr:MAG: hypothetical protein M1831_000116 [Alyxoria varia]
MAPNLEISIPSTSTSSTTKPYTIYHITLRSSLRNYTLEKRYSDFDTLHATLNSQCNAPPPTPLPTKSWFKSTVASAALTEDRRRGLEEYLRSINDATDPRWRSCKAWREFLVLPNSVPGSWTEGRASDVRGPVMDATVWLDVHRDLKALLRETRQAIERRDRAEAPQMQHDAASEASRSLVRGATMWSSLDSGLQAMGGSGSGNKTGAESGQQCGGRPLGAGELRRRRDLLNAAKKERESLEELLNTATKRGGAGYDDQQEASEATKDLLWKGSASAQGQSTSKGGRVLGAAKETERTRELDNSGVLQLQRQVMEEQDQDVIDLTRVVARMKEMGVQINEELALQNEMLDVFDKDVERVGNKLTVAKKRVGKIN